MVVNFIKNVFWPVGNTAAMMAFEVSTSFIILKILKGPILLSPTVETLRISLSDIGLKFTCPLHLFTLANNPPLAPPRETIERSPTPSENGMSKLAS